MIHNFEEWKQELHELDAELVALLQRRLELALEALQLLTSEELSAGDLDLDTLSLGILLQSQCEGSYPPLDEAAVKKIFRRIVIETRRLARSSVASGLQDDKHLTPREREVLILMAEDNSLKQIAKKLNISVKTVESHRAAIMRKLNIYSSVGLTRYAIQEGLISL